MLQKFFRLTLAASIGALLVFPGTSSAGAPLPTLTVTPASTSITAGQSVTFTVTYSCGYVWTAANVQLFNGQKPMTTASKLGSVTSLTPPASTGTTVTQTITVTFAQAGTYTVNADVRDVIVGNQVDTYCNKEEADATGTVTVAAAPTTTAPATTTTTPATTTTVAATTTLAPTTTTVAPTTTTTPVVTTKKLPSTGAQPNALVLALSAFAVGFAALAVRKRRI